MKYRSSVLSLCTDVSGLAPDCLVTPPMGFEGSAAREALRSAFRRQAGALDRLPASAGEPPAAIRGTQSELATVIERAVESWRGHRAEQPHLVLNLSLGWEPRYGGRFAVSPDELPAPTRAVYAALTHASCLDAVVIAAAGNDSGGPELRQGAVYPAAWETRPAPDASVCAAFEGPGL